MTASSVVINTASGSLPGRSSRRNTDDGVSSSIHCMKCSSVMGCPMVPTVTLYPPSIFSITGTCFSCDASVVLPSMRLIGLPQHTNVPAPLFNTSTRLPQMGQWYNSLFSVIMYSFLYISTCLSDGLCCCCYCKDSLLFVKAFISKLYLCVFNHLCQRGL